jgi:hypothetical protein
MCVIAVVCRTQFSEIQKMCGGKAEKAREKGRVSTFCGKIRERRVPTVKSTTTAVQLVRTYEQTNSTSN